MGVMSMRGVVTLFNNIVSTIVVHTFLAYTPKLTHTTYQSMSRKRSYIIFRNIRISLNLINLFGIMRFRNITLSCRRVSRYTGTSTVEGCWSTHVDTHQHEIILRACTSCKRDECFHMRPHWVSHRFEVDDPRAVPFQRHSAREVAVSVGQLTTTKVRRQSRM